jgi:hypothetical protein
VIQKELQDPLALVQKQEQQRHRQRGRDHAERDARRQQHRRFSELARVGLEVADRPGVERLELILGAGDEPRNLAIEVEAHRPQCLLQH